MWGELGIIAEIYMWGAPHLIQHDCWGVELCHWSFFQPWMVDHFIHSQTLRRINFQ